MFGKKKKQTTKTTAPKSVVEEHVTEHDLKIAHSRFLAVSRNLDKMGLSEVRNLAFKKPMKFYREYGTEEAVNLLKKEAAKKARANSKPKKAAAKKPTAKKPTKRLK